MTQTLTKGPLMGADALDAMPTWNGYNRAEGITGTIATPATLTSALKMLGARVTAELDAPSAAALATAVETIKGAFLMSPSRRQVYVMRETSRTIKGAKWRGLSVVRVIPAADVIALVVS